MPRNNWLLTSTSPGTHGVWEWWGGVGVRRRSESVEMRPGWGRGTTLVLHCSAGVPMRVPSAQWWLCGACLCAAFALSFAGLSCVGVSSGPGEIVGLVNKQHDGSKSEGSPLLATTLKASERRWFGKGSVSSTPSSATADRAARGNQMRALFNSTGQARRQQYTKVIVCSVPVLYPADCICYYNSRSRHTSSSVASLLACVLLRLTEGVFFC